MTGCKNFVAKREKFIFNALFDLKPMQRYEIIVRMPEPDCFLRYRISAAMQNFITSGKSNVYVLAARRCSEAWF